jgi:hypothetical protein
MRFGNWLAAIGVAALVGVCAAAPHAIAQEQRGAGIASQNILRDARFLLNSAYQDPRSIRFGVKWSF